MPYQGLQSFEKDSVAHSHDLASVAVPSGLNRALIGFFYLWGHSTPTPQNSLASLVLDPGGGDEAAFAKLDAQLLGPLSNKDELSLWWLPEAGLAASGSFTVRATVNDSDASRLYAVLLHLENLVQTTPTNILKALQTIKTIGHELTTGAAGSDVLSVVGSAYVGSYSHYAAGTEILDTNFGPGLTISATRESRAAAGALTVSHTFSGSPVEQAILSVELPYENPLPPKTGAAMMIGT